MKKVIFLIGKFFLAAILIFTSLGLDLVSEVIDILRFRKISNKISALSLKIYGLVPRLKI